MTVEMKYMKCNLLMKIHKGAKNFDRGQQTETKDGGCGIVRLVLVFPKVGPTRACVYASIFG